MSKDFDQLFSKAVEYLDDPDAKVLLDSILQSFISTYLLKRSLRRSVPAIRKLRKGSALTKQDVSALVSTAQWGAYTLVANGCAAMHKTKKMIAAAERVQSKKAVETPASTTPEKDGLDKLAKDLFGPDAKGLFSTPWS